MKKQFKHAEALGIRFIVAISDEAGTLELIDSKDRSRFRGDVAAVIGRIKEVSAQ